MGYDDFGFPIKVFDGEAIDPGGAAGGGLGLRQ